MNILVVGQGGREHAIAWKLRQSPGAGDIFVAPGNAGTHNELGISNVPIECTDVSGLVTFAKSKNIELVVIGPEVSLAAGIVDIFNAEGILCIGPSRKAAQLETSKKFAKDFLTRHGIKTAAHRTFTYYDQAKKYIKDQKYPIVIKASGLASGKGVVICENYKKAKKTLKSMLIDQHYGDAGNCVVVEEFLQGEEASYICLIDDNVSIPLASSQDYKPRDEGNMGPNTGGMGAYSPAPIITDNVYDKIERDIINPTLNGMKQEGISYRGFLYVGLMIDENGTPNVLEFNCRLGDPETQPILLRLQSDFLELCLACANSELKNVNVKWDPKPAVGVVMASGGYPSNYITGHKIQGLDHDFNNVQIFHAGTAMNNEDVVTSGGRVLCVASLGNSIEDAAEQTYIAVENITWKDCFYRKDIGKRYTNKKR